MHFSYVLFSCERRPPQHEKCGRTISAAALTPSSESWDTGRSGRETYQVAGKERAAPSAQHRNNVIRKGYGFGKFVWLEPTSFTSLESGGTRMPSLDACVAIEEGESCSSITIQCPPTRMRSQISGIIAIAWILSRPTGVLCEDSVRILAIARDGRAGSYPALPTALQPP